MSSATAPKRIVLKSPYGRYDEGVAGGAIKPGHLLSLNSSGEYVVHPTAGGQCERIFAIEDALQGDTIESSYAADDTVRMHHALPGDEIYAWLDDGEDVSIGDFLESAGDGTLQKGTGTNLEVGPVAVALEAVNLNTGTAVADGRIKVRVL